MTARTFTDRAFIDTNVLIYAFSKTDEPKRKKALTALDSHHIVISTQVIREFIAVATHRLNHPIEKIMPHIDHILNTAEVINEDTNLIKDATKIHQKYRYQFYDCLIIAAAIKSNCKILLSEDLHATQKIGKLTIINPFSA